MFLHLLQTSTYGERMVDMMPTPAMTPRLTLVYAKMQALAEPARMLLSYANVPFEDVYPWDYYGKAWQAGGKQEAPFGQVPVLVVDDDVSIDQSGSIQRYLATLTGTCPADPLVAAQADALCDNAGELFAISNPVANFFTGERFAESVAAFQTSFSMRLQFFRRRLAEHADGPFFLGEKPAYCDFTIFHHFQIAELLIPEVFTDYPDVQAFMAAMAELPGLSSYLSSRPALVDVGKAPMLSQDGEPIKPGFQ